MAVGVQPLTQLIRPGVGDAPGGTRSVPRLDNLLLAKPMPEGVPGEPGLPRDLAQRQVVAEVHPPDLGQHAHFDHSPISLPKNAAG